MASYNLCTFIGNLTADPRSREVGEHDVCSFRIAVNNRFKKDDEPLYLDVDVWGKTGKACSENLEKGNPVCVTGSLSMRTYTPKDGGADKTVIQLRAQDVVFLGGGKKRDRDDDDRGGRGRDRERGGGRDRGGRDRDRDSRRNEDDRPRRDRGNAPPEDDIPF